MRPVAPPGFCNSGEVRYGSRGSRVRSPPEADTFTAVHREFVGFGMSCDTKKFYDNESTHILYKFWTSTHRGGSFPLPPLAAPLYAAPADARTQAQQKPAVRRRCRSTGQTDGRTDTRSLHRPCSAYCAGSVNKRARIRPESATAVQTGPHTAHRRSSESSHR